MFLEPLKYFYDFVSNGGLKFSSKNSNILYISIWNDCAKKYSWFYNDVFQKLKQRVFGHNNANFGNLVGRKLG